MKLFMLNIPVKRIFKISALTCIGVLLLLSVCMAILPLLVSTPAVQKKLQQSLSTSMKRQVTWSKLVMTWANGLTLSGLTLGNGPAPLLKTDIDQIIIAPAVGSGPDGRFGVDFAVKVRNVRIELAPGPVKAPQPKATKDPLTQLAESIQKIQGFDFPLPLDVRVLVEVSPLQVAYQVPLPGKSMRLEDFSFRFAMPSLAVKPITAEVNGRVSVDGLVMGKVGLNAKVSNLVTSAQRIHLAAALCAVEAVAPGTRLTLSGGLSQVDGFVADWKLDLPKLLTVAHPFVPPTVPKLAGTVELQLLAKNDAHNDLRAAMTITGAGLAASGGSLKARQAGPLDVKLQQQIATDHTRQRVQFTGGTCSIPGLIDAAWSAAVDRPTVPERSLELTFGPLRINLARVFSVAAPFLPPNAAVKELNGEMFLRSLSLKLAGPGNNGDLAIAGLGIKLPSLRLALAKGELRAEDVELLLDSMACPMTAKLPTKLSADLLWGLRRATVSGTQPLQLDGARGKAQLAVTDLNLKSSSPRKVTASATLKQSMELDKFSVGNRSTVTKALEQLQFQVRATETGEIEASVPEFVVTVAALQGVQSGKQFGPVPLAASLTAAGIHLPADKAGKPTLQRVTALVSADNIIKLNAEVALSGVSPQHATSSGTAQLDLKRIMLFASPFVPSGLKASGAVSAAWNLAASLPEKAPDSDNNPLRRAKALLSLFDKLECGVKLDTISLTVPSAKGALTVSGLNTAPDVHFVSAKKGESVRLEGGIQISSLSGLSGTAGKLPSQRGMFAFSGDLYGWSELYFREHLRFEPVAVSHEAELNVSRIDALLEEKQPFSMATLFKRLDATLFASVDGTFSREMKQLLPGIDVAGVIGSGVRIDLAAGRELAVRYSVNANDFAVRLANGTKVEGVRSDIAVNRVYALAASRGEPWTPLSNALVRPAAVISANPGAKEIVGRIQDDLRGDLRGTRSFSIRKVSTKASGVPLELSMLEGDLLFTQEKAGLSFFQADLLGGTLLARSVFDLRPEVPAIVAASSFSNLDIARLLPKESGRGDTDPDAEITGEISLSAPLTAEQRELFEQLRLSLNVRKIGANTIDRALFSLDPYERNEQVVAQRKTLRLGTLKGLRANAVDGSFGMEGEVQIKGIAVDLPKVERLRISELPLRQELVKNRSGIKALRGLLDMVRADTIVVGPNGELSLKRRSYAQ